MDRRVALYVRVSTSEQSTELQERELLAYAKSRGWDLYKIYSDKSTGTNDRRPELQALLTASRERKFDVVLCWKLDRLFRSLKGIVTTLQEFEELDIEFVSLKDHIDMTSSAGRLLTHILGSFAQFEADIIRERVRAGLANAKAKGKRLGAPRKIDRDTVLKLRRQGLSLSKIAIRVKATKGGVSKTLKELRSQGIDISATRRNNKTVE